MSDDIGYFGPQSVTWRIHSDPLSLVSGLRALLLQALHPGAMLRLAEQSNFQDAPWERLQRTALYVATVAFAPRDEVDRMAARVRGIHQRLGIDDQEQLVWVHCCEVDSFLAGARRSGLRISTADGDRYVLEQVRAAELVGIDAGTVPTCEQAVADYFGEMRPGLRATREARAAARVVLAPPMTVPARFALPARVGWTAVASLSAGMLPAWARRMYRLPWVPGTDAANAIALRSLRAATSAVPQQYRRSPMYRAALERARVAAA